MLSSLEGELGQVFDTGLQEVQQPMSLYCSHRLHTIGLQSLQSPSWLSTYGTKHRQQTKSDTIHTSRLVAPCISCLLHYIGASHSDNTNACTQKMNVEQVQEPSMLGHKLLRLQRYRASLQLLPHATSASKLTDSHNGGIHLLLALFASLRRRTVRLLLAAAKTCALSCLTVLLSLLSDTACSTSAWQKRICLNNTPTGSNVMAA